MNNQAVKSFANITLAVAIIGLLTFTAGLVFHNNFGFKNGLFAIGSTLLSIASFLDREYFFSCLEGIAVITALLEIFHIDAVVSTTVLILLVVLTIFLIYRTRKINFHLVIGIIGLILLSLGIIFSTNLLMFIAGVALCLYSYLSAKSGFRVGWVFLVLNMIFTFVAAINI